MDNDWQGNANSYKIKRSIFNYIFIDGYAHDKQTLSPVFATNYKSWSSHTPSCHLENNDQYLTTQLIII